MFGIARDGQSGSSHFETTFTNDAEASYHLTASAALSPAQVIGGIGWGDTLGEVAIGLREQGGAVLASLAIDQSQFCDYIDGFCAPGSGSLDQSGTLPAGSYLLTARASGFASGWCLDIGGGLTCFTTPSTGSFELDFTLASGVPALGPAGPALLGLALGLGALRLRRRSASEVAVGSGRCAPAPQRTRTGATTLRTCTRIWTSGCGRSGG